MGIVIVLSVVGTVGTFYFAKGWVEAIVDERIRGPGAPQAGVPSTDQRPTQPEPLTSPVVRPEKPLPSPSPGNPVIGHPPPDTTDNSEQPRTIFDVLSIEDIQIPEKTQVPFPSTYFNHRLMEELGTVSTNVPQVRLGVAFVEPSESRHLSNDGTITGHIVISLPTLQNCSRVFGDQTYTFADPTTGIMKAISDHTTEVADWIRSALRGGTLSCPS